MKWLADRNPEPLLPAIVSRITLTGAILLVSVLIHLGVFGALVLAERRALPASQAEVVDVELVQQAELPEPPKEEPPKPELPKPELSTLALPQPEQPKSELLPTPAPAPAEAASTEPSSAEPLPPEPTAPPAASVEEAPEPAAAAVLPAPSAKPEKPAAPSGGAPSEGKSRLTPEEIAALRAQVQKCWQLPVGIPGVLGLEIVIRVSFGPRGQLVGEPVLLKAPASERGPLLVGIAMRALKECAPYRMPAAKYADWKTLDLRFLATGMTGLGIAPRMPSQAKR